MSIWLTPEWCCAEWKRVNPGQSNASFPPSLYLLDFARAVRERARTEEIDQRRADFVAGAYWMSDPEKMESHDPYKAAARRFPYPTQPRIIEACRGFWRVVNGELQHSWRRSEGWVKADSPSSDFRAIADLLDDPNEDAP